MSVSAERARLLREVFGGTVILGGLAVAATALGFEIAGVVKLYRSQSWESPRVGHPYLHGGLRHQEVNIGAGINSTANLSKFVAQNRIQIAK